MTQTEHHLPPQQASRSRLKLLIALAILLAVAATAYSVWEKARRYHLATVQEGVLYRDGMKSVTQFAATLDSVHPHTVVSLIDNRELADRSKPQFAQEEELCASRGIKLERIPVVLGGWPSTSDVQRFLRIVADKQNQPVLVHCAQGVRRTGLFVAAYQESALGYDKERAVNAIESFGHSDSTKDQIAKFITGYNPSTQTVSPDLGHGSE